MSLDILTPKGAEATNHEQKLLQDICNVWNVDILETPKKEPAKIDGIIIENNKMTAVFEDKCRKNMVLNDDKQFYLKEHDMTVDSCLITYNKIDGGRLIGGALGVPFWGFLYLIDQDITLWWEIANKHGEFKEDINHRNSLTQKTVNGGTIVRDNAYLPLSSAHYLEDTLGLSNL